ACGSAARGGGGGWGGGPKSGGGPWGIFSRAGRAPATSALDYFALSRLLTAGRNPTVCDVVGRTGPLYERLWRPVLLAALNAEPTEASARLAGAVVRESLARGGAACRPLIAADGLAAACVDPALAYLAQRGAALQFGHQLHRLDLAEDRVRALDFGEDVVELAPRDLVILAVPAWVAPALVPELAAPRQFRSILNAHFAI